MKNDTDKHIDSIKQNREKVEAILYVCSVAYCFQSTITAQVLVAAFWIAWMFFRLVMDLRAGRTSERIKDCVFAAMIFLLPQLVIHVYTIALAMFGQTKSEVLSTNIVTNAAILLVIVSIYLFDRKAMWYVFCALSLSWFLYLVEAVLTYGPGVITDAIMQGWFGVTLGHENYLEHDAIVLSVGYGILLFLFAKRETNRKAIPLYWMLAIIFLIGIKRISVLAVLLVVACYLIVRKKDEKKAYTISVIAGWIAAVACVAFIFVVSLGDPFYEFMDKLGIDLMARDHFHKYIMKYTEFSPLFLGYGRGSVKTWMVKRFSGYTYVHSDIIKMFFELGFIPFLGWLYFNLVFVAKSFKKRYSESAAVFYMLTSAYTFVQYLTDNTESYFVCIVVRSIIVMGYALSTAETEEGRIRRL